jgi:hypothetical protein
MINRVKLNEPGKRLLQHDHNMKSSRTEPEALRCGPQDTGQYGHRGLCVWPPCGFPTIFKGAVSRIVTSSLGGSCAVQPTDAGQWHKCCGGF